MISGDDLVFSMTQQPESRGRLLGAGVRTYKTTFLYDQELFASGPGEAAVDFLERRKAELLRKVWDQLYGDLSIEIAGILDAAEAGGMAEVCGRLAGVRKMLEYPGDR